MNSREKILAAAFGLAAVAFVTYLAINKVFLGPAADRDNQARDLTAKISRLKTEKGKETANRGRLKELAGLTFGADDMRVSEQVRMMATEVLTLSGLSTQNLSLKPLIGSRVPGVYKEIGWTVRARGKLGHVISFLYLMSKESHLHRLDNIVLSPVPGGTDVELQVKYATLVLEPPKGEKLVVAESDEVLEPGLLESPERQQYNLIVARDLFRPYMPGKPKEPERPAEQPRSPSEPSTPRTPDGRYRLVGLPTWGGGADVLIRDAGTGKVASFKTGDDLAGGKIVVVDYRPLPMPNNPEILSGSRVVLQIGQEYYAVELGASLAEKHPLPPDRLPPGLPKLEPAPPQAPAPSTGSEPEKK